MRSPVALLRGLLYRLRHAKSTNIAAWQLAAAERVQAGDFDQAGELFRRILAVAPDDVVALSGLAFNAAKQQDFAEAMQRWDDVVGRFPDDYWGAIGRANTLADSGRLDEAEAAFEQAVSRWPEQREALSGHAHVAHRQRRFKRAILRWESVLQRFPQDDWATLNLGLDLMELAEYGRAQRSLAELVGRLPDDLAAGSAHAELAFQTARYADAVLRWDSVLEKFPDHYQALIGSALALINSGQFELAERSFQQALEASGGDVDSLSQYPAALLRKKWYALALDGWQRIASRYPEDVGVRVSIADSHFEMGDYASAELLFLDAQARWPGSLGGYHSHARLLERQRCQHQAEQCYSLQRERPHASDGADFIVCEAHKFMFVVIAGNASRALQRLVWSLDNPALGYSVSRPDDADLAAYFAASGNPCRRVSRQQSRQKKYAGYLKFALYRPPLDRLLALYNRQISPNRPDANLGAGYFQQLGIVDADLSDFVDLVATELSRQEPSQQHEKLRGQSSLYDPGELDWIVPISRLDAFLSAELGVQLAQLPDQPGAHCGVDAAQAAMIDQLYGADLDLLAHSNIYAGGTKDQAE